MKVGRNTKNNPSPLPGKEAAKPAEGHKQQPKPFIFINIFYHPADVPPARPAGGSTLVVPCVSTLNSFPPTIYLPKQVSGR